MAVRNNRLVPRGTDVGHFIRSNVFWGSWEKSIVNGYRLMGGEIQSSFSLGQKQ
jgi:hypothetical protein